MEKIAIIGVGCRFPGAHNPESFWQLLDNGVDAITEVPKERWDINLLYDPQPKTTGKMNTRWGGFINKVDQFDPSFFGISPREAERMDPQHRLVLEVAWESLENAGIAPPKLNGTKTGVFLGIGNYDYGRLLIKDLTKINAYDGIGNTLCIAANRLSYLLNLKGPSLVLESACSSSLVSVHYACESLKSGESDLCFVGGVSLILSPEPTITYSHARMMSPKGRCKTFDASADGYVRSEGCGIVVLKRLTDALADGDNVQAVIVGSAVNQDGHSNGLTAPNGLAQQAVIRQALENAQVAPHQISYVETHGTGTSLGDPLEFEALKQVLMENRSLNNRCAIGSVKTNIGHLEAASGIAGLIKVTLMLQHKKIPTHLHLQTLNPYIDIEDTPLFIPTTSQTWETNGSLRLAGLSSFGFGGTNSHLILEEHLKIVSGLRKFERPVHIFTLSAKTEKALEELTQDYQTYLAANLNQDIGNICFTTNTGRSHFEHRLAVVVDSIPDLSSQLSSYFNGDEPAKLIKNSLKNLKQDELVFLFTGQGSQFPNMGYELYQTQPIFRQTLDYCEELLRPHLDISLLSILYPEKENNTFIHQTVYAQPALFALEYALAQVWKSWGLEPAVMIGHSLGEYVAATISGVFSLEDALKLVAKRGKLIQSLPLDGAMEAVWASKEQIDAYIKPYLDQVSIATINGVNNCVISGKKEIVQLIAKQLKEQEVKTKNLEVSHAFHSPLIEPILSEFRKIANEISYSAPKIPIISNLTGEIATTEIATPDYWCRHLREPVNFLSGIEFLTTKNYRIFLEIGPKPTLLGMIGHYLSESNKECLSLPSLHPKNSDFRQMLQSLGNLYVQGVIINWDGFEQDYVRQKIQLPTYPFQRQRYWLDIDNLEKEHPSRIKTTANSTSIITLIEQGNVQKLSNDLGKTGQFSEDQLKLLPKLLEVLVNQHHQELTKETIKDWFYEIKWQIQKETDKSPVSAQSISQEHPWLILADRQGVGVALAKLLEQSGIQSILLYADEIAPVNSIEFKQSLKKFLEQPLQRIIHLWSLDAPATNNLTTNDLEQAEILTLASTLNLVQALVDFSSSRDLSLWLVTQGVLAVENSQVALAEAPLWGLGKTLSIEHPEWFGGLIDLPVQIGETEIKELLQIILDAQEEDQIVLRQGKRYVPRLVPFKVSDSKAYSLSAEHSYLITGGLGVLGLQVAQWLVKQGVEYLVLFSRSKASESVQEKIQQMEQKGAKILVVQGDISIEEEMKRLFAQIGQTFPPLKGVIHCAGISSTSMLKDLDWSEFKSVLKPKIQGTWLLHQLTKNLNLDFFVCFSSISAIWGSREQGHYAAANYFLDTLAHYRHTLGLPTLSINWGPWAGGGVASEFEQFLVRIGVELLPPEQALATLELLLAKNISQITVANIDWNLYKVFYQMRTKGKIFEDLGQEESVQSQSKITPVNKNYGSEILQQLITNAPDSRYSFLVNYLKAETAKILGFNSSQVLDPQASLFDLGMDSLMAMDIVGLVGSQFQAEFTVSELLKASSLNGIAELLLRKLAPDSILPQVEKIKFSLEQEAILDESIVPSSFDDWKNKDIQNIFLTGASGFLGAFLLDGLLQKTQYKVYCLVRESDYQSGLKKIKNNLSKYGLWNEHYVLRIIPVIGDLANPYFGLSDAEYNDLSQNINVIYHSAAILNFVYPFSRLKPVNVLGTQEILRFACHKRVKPLHYVSTDAVFDSSAFYDKEVKESEPILYTEGIDLGYTQTKWVSEKLVTIARERGLPVAIYRPPLITGESQTGRWNTEDFTCLFLKGCIQMGCIPNIETSVTFVPVDYVSKAIICLSQMENSLGNAFHLTNPHHTMWNDVAQWINSLGYSLNLVSYEIWEKKLKEIAPKGENVLSPLLPFFLKRWSDENLTFAQLAQRRVKLNSQATVAQLNQNNIVCHPVDAKLIETYFSYFRLEKFLNFKLNDSLKRK